MRTSVLHLVRISPSYWKHLVSVEGTYDVGIPCQWQEPIPREEALLADCLESLKVSALSGSFSLLVT